MTTLISQNSSRKFSPISKTSFSTLALVLFCILLGGIVALESYVLLLILLIPLGLLYAIVIPISEKFQSRIFFLLGSLLLTAMLIWPRYAYIRINIFPGITPTRLLLALYIFTGLIYVFRSKNFREYFSRIKASQYLPLIFIFLFSLFRFLSVSFSENQFASMYGFANEFVFFTTMTLLFIAAFRTDHDIEKITSILVYVTVFICALGYIEYFLQRNIFMNILPITNDYAREALSSKIRDSGYRIQSTFDHPLAYAQFLVCVIPIVISVFFSNTSFFLKTTALLTFIMILGSVWLTGSRSAVILSLVSVFGVGVSLLIVQFFQKKVRLGTVITAIFGLVFALIVAALLIDQIQSVVAGRSSAEASSTSARLLMLQRAIPLVIDSPIVGHGVNQAASLIGFAGAGGILTVDSLLISFGVESGVIALIAYILCIFSAMFYAFQTSVKFKPESMIMHLSLANSILIFFMSTITLSLTGNMFFLAFLIAAVLTARQKAVSA